MPKPSELMDHGISSARFGFRKKSGGPLILSLYLGFFWSVAVRSAPVEISLVQIQRSAGGDAPRFGDSLAIRNGMVLVGDTNWSTFYETGMVTNGNTGAVHLFDISNPPVPTRRAYFTGSDSQSGSYFGTSVSVSGNLLLVGAPFQESIGAAYLFDISDPRNPVQRAKIVASDRTSLSMFGQSVALDGSLALIGTPAYYDVPGAAYLFDVSNPSLPSQKAKITAQSPANSDRFGTSVSVHEGSGRALIGAPSGVGFAELYSLASLTTPIHLSTMSATADSSSGNQFGFAVSLAASAALIGAPGRDDMGIGDDTGAAYLFDLSSPSLPTGVQIIASDRALRYRFGYALQMQGKHAVIGATGSNSGTNGVHGYHFDISNLASPVEAGKLNPSNWRLFNIAMGIAIDGHQAVLSPVNNENQDRLPAVSLFKLFDPEIDLSHAGDVTGFPAQVLPGASFTLDGSVANAGNVPSGSFQIRAVLSSDANATTADGSVGTEVIADLDSGSTDPFAVSVVIPQGFRLGHYYLGVLLDALSRVSETDETNNAWVSSSLIRIGTPEAILKQGEIDINNRSIASTNRQIKSTKRKLANARKKHDSPLIKLHNRKLRKLNSLLKSLKNKGYLLRLELDILLQPE